MMFDKLLDLSDAIVKSGGAQRLVAVLPIPPAFKALAGLFLSRVSEDEYQRYVLGISSVIEAMAAHDDVVDAVNNI